MPIVDLMLAPTTQPWKRIHFRLGVPDFDPISKNSNLNLLANQTTVDRISVALHTNQAASIDADAELGERVESTDVERLHGLLFFGQTLTATALRKSTSC